MGKKYFTGLNYTLGNEDTTLEVELVKHFRSKNLLSICGSGGRSLPLLSAESINLTLLDLSSEQILLAQLREATYKQLSYEEFLLFWSYFPYRSTEEKKEREIIFLKLDLPVEVRAFFKEIFEKIGNESLLYLGAWERTFKVLARINRFILGKNFDQILKCQTLEEQRAFYENNFPHRRWKIVLFLLGNKTLFNALLYKGDFIQKNTPLSHYEYYHKAFEHLMTQGLATKSFFLHLCFYGEINSQLGNPIEADEEIFQKIKMSKSKIQYLTQDFLTHLKSGIAQYDFLSLSDVPSYFSGETEFLFMQMIRPGLLPGAIIVNRYYLRKPDCDLSGFNDLTAQFQNLLSLEKVQMYDIKIYQYSP